MLRRVLTEKGGTAKGINSDLVEIAGKTGTALISKERPKYTRADTLAGRVKPLSRGILKGTTVWLLLDSFLTTSQNTRVW